MAKVIRENSDSNMVEMALEYLKGLEFPKIPSSSTLHKLIAKLKAGKRTERQGINPFYVSNFIKKKKKPLHSSQKDFSLVGWCKKRV